MKCLENVGMLGTVPINFEGKEIVPIQFLKALLCRILLLLVPRTVGKTNIGCIFTGTKKAAKRKTIFILQRVATIRNATKRFRVPSYPATTTGVPAMIGTALVLTKQWQGKGVFNVEEVRSRSRTWIC